MTIHDQASDALHAYHDKFLRGSGTCRVCGKRWRRAYGSQDASRCEQKHARAEIGFRRAKCCSFCEYSCCWGGNAGTQEGVCIRLGPGKAFSVGKGGYCPKFRRYRMEDDE